jgi:hypothetical protein
VVQTPAGRVPVIPVILMGIGVYLAWFAVHYWRSDTKWPTDPVKDVLTGKGLEAPAGQTSAAQIKQNAENPSAPGSIASAPGAAGSAPPVSGTYSLLELETLWTSQGGASDTAYEAANVAMAESGDGTTADPNATSDNPDGGINVGLWQLDTKGVGSGYTIEQLKDPATNCRVTVMATANGTNWSEWADAVVVGGVYVGPKV